MKNLFVSYQVAAELKEKGFDEPCLAYFNGDVPHIMSTRGTSSVDKMFTCRNTFLHDIKNDLVLTPEENFTENGIDIVRSKWGMKVSAPIFQQVVDWFFEKHKIYVFPYRDDRGMWYHISYNGSTEKISAGYEWSTEEQKIVYKSGCFETWDDCKSKAIEEALKLI